MGCTHPMCGILLLHRHSAPGAVDNPEMSMSKATNGGPAFPVDTRSTGNDAESGNYGHQSGPSTWQYGGMTLRDYFAAKALPALIEQEITSANVGIEAYRFADLMLAAR